MPGTRHALYLTVIVCCTALAAGCERKQPAPELPTSPAHAKLLTTLEKEYNIHALTKALPNTLWIYIPLEKTFFEVSVSDKGPQRSPDSISEMNLLYLDGKFEEGFFNVEFDVGQSKKYVDDKGIQSKYSEEYSRISRNLTTAINSAYGEIERKVGTNEYIEKIAGDIDFAGEQKNTTHKTLVQSHVLHEVKVPDFIVVVIADIEKGIETSSLFYLQDLRRAYTDHTFIEEFTKRTVGEPPIGHAIIIGDRDGLHVDYHDVTWNEFLMKQILYRIRFQYQMSSHKPESGDFEIFKDITRQVLQAYPHRDYQGVKFLNLGSKKRSQLNVGDIPPYQDVDKKDPGRIQNIKVNLAPPENGI